MQKTELCMLYLSAFFSSIISYVALKKIASLLSNNGHTSIKIKFLMMKLIMLCEKLIEISYQQHSRNFQRILLYWILENSIYFKTKQKQRKMIFIYLVLFIRRYIILNLYTLFKSKRFSIQPFLIQTRLVFSRFFDICGNLGRNSEIRLFQSTFKLINHTLTFYRQASCTFYHFFFIQGILCNLSLLSINESSVMSPFKLFLSPR